MELGILLLLHALASVVWVGGMFFAFIILRPASAAVLEPPSRLRLWYRVLARFFAWVWVAVVLILATGFRMILAFFGGMKGLATHVNLMMSLGLLMVLLFVFLYFVPFRRLQKAVNEENWAEAGQAMGTVRAIVAVNLVLGVLSVILGAAGKYFFQG